MNNSKSSLPTPFEPGLGNRVADRRRGAGAARGVLPKMFTLPRGWQAGKQQLLLNLQSALRVDNGGGHSWRRGERG